MKNFRFEFSPHAERDFAQLNRVLQKRILVKLDHFEASSDPLGFAKKLSGLNNAYRFRVGDYRIIVEPKENGSWVILVILKIGHRREIYE